MKPTLCTALMALLLACAAAGCSTASVVRGPMSVGADLGGLDGVVGKPAKR